MPLCGNKWGKKALGGQICTIGAGFRHKSVLQFGNTQVIRRPDGAIGANDLMQATRAGRFSEFPRLRPNGGNLPRRIRLRPNGCKIAPMLLIGLLIAWLGLSSIYSLSPIQFLKQAARVAAIPVYSVIYRDDASYVEETTKRYRVGALKLLGSSAE